MAHDRFHDTRILESTGRGVEVEEKRAWKGYWNETLVQISKRSIPDPEVLTVLLTGRSTAYIDILTRMLSSRDLQFDLVVLKPKKERGVNDSTLTFKYAFLDDVLRLGESIDEVDVYEDRVPHRDAFETYLKSWRRFKEVTTQDEHGNETRQMEVSNESESIGLKAFKVHFVEIPLIHLNEEVEENLVRTMIDETNKADMADEEDQYVLAKKVYSLGYAVADEDFQRLFDTCLGLSDSSRHDWRTIRQPSVFIHFKPLPHTLNKVGGYGKQVEFEITHFGASDKVLALSLTPIASYHEVMDGHGDMILQKDSRLRYWSKNDIPVLVLATRNGGKPIDANYLNEWTPMPQSVENRRFIARVAAKQELSIERVSKAEARAREEERLAAENMASTPWKRHSGHFNSHGNSHGSHGGRSGHSENRHGGKSVYGSGASRGGRNAFGYSLS